MSAAGVVEMHCTKLQWQRLPNALLLGCELFLGSCAFVEIGLADEIESCTLRNWGAAFLKVEALRYPGL